MSERYRSHLVKLRVGPCVAGVLSLATLAACSDPIRLDWKHELGAPSVSTPLVTDSYIAVGGETGLSVLGLDGSARCVFDAHGEVVSAPKTDGRLIFFGSTNYIFYAIEPTCAEAWKVPTGDRIKSDPLVADGRVYVSSYDGNFYALDASNGEIVWVFPASANRLGKAAAPVVKQPATTPAVGKKKKKGKKKARRVAEPAPVVPVVKAPPPKEIKTGDFSYSSPVLADGYIYLGNLDGRLYVIKAEDGSLAWSFKAMGPITSTPLVEEGVVYVGSNDGNIYAIDCKTHRVRWKVLTKDWVNSSARIDNGYLYIGANDRHVYAIDITNGEPVWSYDTEGPAIARPSVYGDLVIAAGGSGDGTVYALRAADGSLFWHYTTGGKIESDPIIVGDRLYVSSTDRHLYAFTIVRTEDD